MVAASLCGAATFEEDFAVDPAASGWKTFGNPGLFQWNPTNQNLEVTWDSAQPNSYFYHPLGTILTSNDAFSIAFDLELHDAAITGFSFEIAVGLFHFDDATNPGFLRGTGRNATNLFEFDFFPDFGFGPSLDGTIVDRAGRFRFIYDNLPLDPGSVYRVTLNHPADSASVTGEILKDGNPYTLLPTLYVQPPATNFNDFRLDTVSISSYSDTGASGSILAHGTVDNLIVTLPPPPIRDLTGAFSNDVWQAQFLSRSNWLYTLERTLDFQTWTNVGPVTSGNGTDLTLPDLSPPAAKSFYRVRANRP
jgi:hypothetical protein